MARTDKLTNYLTDVAMAIKNKKGDTTPIKASQFDAEINNLPTGGDISDYIQESISSTSQSTKGGWTTMIKKLVPPKPPVGSSYSYLFTGYSGSELDLSNFDTTNVTEMQYMFSGCNNLSSLDLSNFDTTKVTSMQYMFNGCNNLSSLDLSAFDTTNVADMQYMFSYCNNLSSLDLSNFDTTKVTKMQGMFYGCNNLLSLDLSSFDASKLANLLSAFSYCNNLKNLKFMSNLGKGYSTTVSANYANYRLNLSICPLSYESLMSVINNLYDIKSKGCNDQSLILGTTNMSKLSEDEINIAVEKGWIVA